MTNALPGKRAFFKYAAPDTALAVLRNKAVRYSSPLKFNDPFDVQSGLHFNFNIDTLHSKVLDRIEQLATSNETPCVDREDPWGKIVLLVREKYPTHGFPRHHLETMTAPLFAQLVSDIRGTQQKYQECWWTTLLPGIRVFCVSEERDNLLMWSHYAKDHTGVVFEFLSLPDEDNPLSVAQPVIYADQPATFFTEDEWVDEILAIRRLSERELYKRYAYVKSRHWQYEREWRVWYPLASTPEALYSDCPIRPSEFASIYIGCRADPLFADKVVSLARAAFPNTKLYRAHKSSTTYALEYTEVY